MDIEPFQVALPRGQEVCTETSFLAFSSVVFSVPGEMAELGQKVEP